MGHQRQLADLAFQGKRRLQHHADVVVFVAQMLVKKSTHFDHVLGRDLGVAEDHHGGLFSHQLRHGAAADALAHSFDHHVVGGDQRGMAHRRQGDEPDA